MQNNLADLNKMGGFFYSVTRFATTPFVCTAKALASKNETEVRKALRNTVAPVACAAGAVPLGPAGMLAAAALSKEAMSTIYPPHKD